MTRNYNESIQEISKSQILDAGLYANYLTDTITTPLEHYNTQYLDPYADKGGILGSVSNVFNTVADVIVPRVLLETIDTGLSVTRLTKLEEITNLGYSSLDEVLQDDVSGAKDLALSAISNYI